MNAESHAESIALGNAGLCADCSSVFNLTAREKCPDCGSGAALPLATVLSDRHELVAGLLALSKLITWSKRPAQNTKKSAPVGAITAGEKGSLP